MKNWKFIKIRLVGCLIVCLCVRVAGPCSWLALSCFVLFWLAPCVSVKYDGPEDSRKTSSWKRCWSLCLQRPRATVRVKEVTKLPFWG